MLGITVGKIIKNALINEEKAKRDENSSHENQIGVFPASSLFTSTADSFSEIESFEDVDAPFEISNSSEQLIKEVCIENLILNPEDSIEKQWSYSGPTIGVPNFTHREPANFLHAEPLNFLH